MSEGDHDLKTIVGSRTYMAPEVFDKEKGHGKAVDLYAVGIIMYILLCGYPPFEPENGINDLEFPSPEWDEISEEAKQLIAKLLARDPAKRLMANQILRDPWISGAPDVRRSRSKLFNTQ
jgi:serine/threonine protein kinase